MSGPAVMFRDVALLAPLTRDLERATWFIELELGALAAKDAATADLRRTALAYLGAGGSPIETAQQLQVHRNTVVYRLKRITELLGQTPHRADAGDSCRAPPRVHPRLRRRRGPWHFDRRSHDARFAARAPGGVVVDGSG
ncbi:helix-turn-helix domain-containing protein [Streptomyces sp. L7]